MSEIHFTNAGAWRMTTTKTYDYLNRLTQIASTPSASPVISFAYAYNNANQRTAVTNADGSYWLYGYDALGQVTSGVKYFNTDVPVPGEQFGYAFDNIGNRTSTTVGGDQYGNNLRTSTYGANLNNQYTNRTVPGAVDILGSAVTNATVTVNNQPTYRNGTFYEATLALTNTSAAVWQSITNLAVAHSSSTTDLVATVTGNEFLQQTPESFSYDYDGNLTQDGRWTYHWDAENRLIQMASLTNAPTASKLRLTFGYDPKWRRVSKTVEAYNGSSWTTNLAESFVNDGWNLVDELNATNIAVVRSYMWGLDLSRSLEGACGVGGLLTFANCLVQPSTAFAVYDGSGNVSTLSDALAGTIKANYEYNASGQLLYSAGALSKFNPIRFSSKYQDEESALLNYSYRYYEVGSGRWLGRDPAAEHGGLALYGFVKWDAINLVDPAGKRPIDFAFDAFINGNSGLWLDEPFSLFTQFETDGRGLGQFDKNAANARLFSYGSIESTMIGKSSLGSVYGTSRTGVSHRRKWTIAHGWGEPEEKQAQIQNPAPVIKDVGPCETTITFSPSGGYPFTPSAITPNSDYTVTYDFKVIGKNKVKVTLSGTHNLFPDYEGYADGAFVCSDSSSYSGPGLWDLRGWTSIKPKSLTVDAETDCCASEMLWELTTYEKSKSNF